MSLQSLLMDIGSTLKIISPSSVSVDQDTDVQKPVKIKTRCLKLNELATEIQMTEIKNLSEKPVELSVDFNKIFEAAGIQPVEKGWTIERLCEILDTEQFKKMDRPLCQQAISGMLHVDKIDPSLIIKDAIAKDQSIDAYDQFVSKKKSDRKLLRQNKINEIKEQIELLQKECKDLSEIDIQEENQVTEWLIKKQSFEMSMASAVNVLTKDTVISITEVKSETKSVDTEKDLQFQNNGV